MHLLVKVPPRLSVSELMEVLKVRSASGWPSSLLKFVGILWHLLCC